MGKEEKGHFGRKNGLARTVGCVNEYSAEKCYRVNSVIIGVSYGNSSCQKDQLKFLPL